MKRVDHYRESVWWADDLKAAEKLLLLALSRFMDHDTLGGARPGKGRLVRLTGLSEASVKRYMRSMIAKGWLVEDHRGGAPRGAIRLASIYRGAIPDRGQPDPTTGVRLAQDWGQPDPPPFKGPGRPSEGFAHGSPNNDTSTVGTTSANGARCEVCNDLPIAPPCVECSPEPDAIEDHPVWREMSNEELLADWEINSPRDQMEADYLASVPHCTGCGHPMHRPKDIDTGRCPRCRLETTT